MLDNLDNSSCFTKTLKSAIYDWMYLKVILKKKDIFQQQKRIHYSQSFHRKYRLKTFFFR